MVSEISLLWCSYYIYLILGTLDGLAKSYTSYHVEITLMYFLSARERASPCSKKEYQIPKEQRCHSIHGQQDKHWPSDTLFNLQKNHERKCYHYYLTSEEIKSGQNERISSKSQNWKLIEEKERERRLP